MQNTKQKQYQSILMPLKYNLRNTSQFARFWPFFLICVFLVLTLWFMRGFVPLFFFVWSFVKREIESNFLEHKMGCVGSIWEELR